MTTSSTPNPHTWTIDPSHSGASFRVRHMMVTNVRGEFQKLSGTVHYDPARPEESSVNVTIDVASINTREAARDDHLRGPDFFDVAKFPNITFVSRSVKALGGGKLEVTGDLTIRDVTREVKLDVDGPGSVHVDPWGQRRIGASAHTKIRRSDFGITWNTALEAGGVLVGDEVNIELDVSLIQQGKE